MRITTTVVLQAATRQAEVQAELAAARAQAQADIAAERAAQAGERAEAAAEELGARIARDVERAIDQGNISVSTQGDRQIIKLSDGREIIIRDGNVVIDGMPVSGTPTVIDSHDDIPALALQTGQRITLFICMAIAFIVVGLPIARAFARWLDRRGTVSPGASDTAQRLAAIENAVESVAIEVERISEGQRFTARLLSDRAREGVPVGADRLG